MSKENRRRMYNQLVKENKLYQDDGALVREFGIPKVKEPEPIQEEPVKKKEPKKVKKHGR